MKRRTSSTPRPCVCPTLEAPTGRRRLTSACSWRAVIVLKQTECCAPDRARVFRPTLLGGRAGRPHLLRNAAPRVVVDVAVPPPFLVLPPSRCCCSSLSGS